MRIIIRRKSGDFAKNMDAATSSVATAVTGAVRDVGRIARDNARANVAAAGFGTDWQQSFQMKFFPKHGISMNPEVLIFSRVNYAEVFEHDTTINPKTNYLWLPLPAVPPFVGSGLKFGGIVGRKHMTPRQYVRNVGPLITLKRAGKPPILAALIVEGPWGPYRTKGMIKRVLKAGKTKRKIVPMYVGVDTATIKKRFDIAGAVDAARAQLGKCYLAEREKLRTLI